MKHDWDYIPCRAGLMYRCTKCGINEWIQADWADSEGTVREISRIVNMEDCLGEKKLLKPPS